ncbi:hypothetical protein SDC9_156295 [bioreactor metagenome]|uniref:Uncharacterized protein n=1 Tax=bioreactor metagenome TaxID=1076179 RepID=A0A645F4A9_9ZZZZ
MHSNIYKSAKVDDVAHCAYQLHVWLQVLNAQNIGLKVRLWRSVTGVTSRLFQLLDNIPQRRLADFQHGRCGLYVQSVEPGDRVGQLIGLQVRSGQSHAFQQVLNRLVGFGMDASVVQDIVPVVNPQEARALFKGLCAQALDLFDLLAAPEFTVLFTVVNDVFGNGFVDACHVL